MTRHATVAVLSLFSAFSSINGDDAAEDTLHTCAMVYVSAMISRDEAPDDDDLCSGLDASVQQPVQVPLDTCVCDRDGKIFETAPGICAMLTGVSGWFTLRIFQDDDNSCTTPVIYAPPVQLMNVGDCERHGSDIVMLQDNCPKYKPICVHPGEVHNDTDQCTLSPKCPVTVQDPQRHCCQNRTGATSPIPGFCVEDIQLGDYVQNGTTDCEAEVTGPGWQGCRCEDERGAFRVCTLECTPSPDPDQNCIVPVTGIPETLGPWQPSEAIAPHVVDTGPYKQREDPTDSSAFRDHAVVYTIMAISLIAFFFA